MVVLFLVCIDIWCGFYFIVLIFLNYLMYLIGFINNGIVFGVIIRILGI